MATETVVRSTIVLVGGQLTLEDGTTVDSRQSMSDKAMARAVADALVGSHEWWTTVVSIVIPTLADHAGGFAYTDQLTVSRVNADGRTSRVRFPRYPRGSGKEDYIYNPRTLEAARFPKKPRRRTQRQRAGVARKRAIDLVAPVAAQPRIRIDTSGTALLSIVDGTAAWPFVVMPDTAKIRGTIDRILGGTNFLPDPEIDEAHLNDPKRYLQLPTKRAECFVTGLLVEGEWKDAGALEAARRLLLERFDLKIGLWDLASNPVLRAAVLAPSSLPMVPTAPAAPPAKAVRRAMQQAGGIATVLHSALEAHGWRLWGSVLLHSIRGNSNQPKHPYLRLLVGHSQVKVFAWHWGYDRYDINAFVDAHQAEFEEIARLPPRKTYSSSSARLNAKYRKANAVVYEAGRKINDTRWVLLWAMEVGWSDLETDWSRVAAEVGMRTDSWVNLLEKAATEAMAARSDLHG
jgi:hypothetical protein